MKNLIETLKNIKNLKTTLAGLIGLVVAGLMFHQTQDVLNVSAIVITSLGLIASQDAKN